jgi:DNA helicase-2/ATP-dependent DNA helicase PcrA
MTDAAELEEERRLAYVGVTRAQQRLYLSHAWSRMIYGQTQYNPPSRFLGEIPEHLLDARESEHRGRRRGRDAGRYQAGGPAYGGGRDRGYSVVGLPGREGEVQVQPGWSPSRPAGVPKHDAPTIQPGDTVVHERFGEGVVLTVSGFGEDAEARVAFSDVGEKNLLLSYAPLKKVG